MLAAEPLWLAGCGSVNGVPPPPCLRQPASRAAHATNATRIKPRRLALFITCLSKKEPCRPRARPAEDFGHARLPTHATQACAYNPYTGLGLSFCFGYLTTNSPPAQSRALRAKEKG